MKKIMDKTWRNSMWRFFSLAACWVPGALMAESGNQVYHAVVAQDGTGDYATVQQAIDAAPAGRTAPWLIFVKNGSYKECVVVPEDKPFIHLIGQDKDRTIVHQFLNVGGKPEAGKGEKDTQYWAFSVHNPVSEVYNCEGSVVTVKASDFYTAHISYVNDYGVDYQKGPQALAMKSQGNRAAFYNCAFRSFQDTWMTTTRDENRHYVRDCWIEGAVDYFYGGGNVLVENSTFYNVRRGSVIVAPCHKDAEYGYVFRHCVVDGNAEAVRGSQVKLGRPWHNSPKTVYIHTTMKIPVAQEGWTNMGAIPALFAEYDSRDAEGRVLDLGGRKTEYQGRGDNPPQGSCRATVTKEEADRLTYENMIPGNDGWNPRAMMEQLPAPKRVKAKGNELSWTKVRGAIGYVVLHGDAVAGFAKEPSFRVPEAPGEEWRVRAVNRFGLWGK